MMSNQLYILFLINILTAIGYSLIPPLYPEEAYKRGIKDDLCGLVISMFGIANIIITPFTPNLILFFGKKRLYFISTILIVKKLFYLF
jgi:hypothetical protein